MTLTVLDRLRRFARLLIGNVIDGDALILGLIDADTLRSQDKATNERLRHPFSVIVRSVGDDTGYSNDGPSAPTILQERAQDELAVLNAFDRKVFGLHEVERYDADDIALMLQTGVAKVEIAIERARQAMFRRQRVVLYFEPDPSLGRIIGGLLRQYGLHVDVYSEEEAAVAELRYHEPDLLLIEPSIDGIAEATAVIERVQELENPVIWFTGSAAERAAAWRGSVVTKPGTPEALVDAVQRAVYAEPHAWTSASETFLDDHLLSDLDVSDEALASTPAPIDAEIVDDQLRTAPSAAPASAVSFTALDALREQHLRNARFQAQEAHSSNAAPRLRSHFDAIVDLLDRPLTERMVLGLSVGVDALTRFLPVIEEEFSRVAAIDIAGFLLDLQRFTNQFPVSRDFNGEAAAHRPISAAEDGALSEITDRLLAQPDEVVAAELKRDLALLQQSRARQAGSTISDIALIRSNSNVLKAIARAVRRWLGDLASSSGKHASDNLGKLIGAVPTAGALYLLSTHFPVEFAAVTTILTWAAKQTKAITGGVEEDEEN